MKPYIYKYVFPIVAASAVCLVSCAPFLTTSNDLVENEANMSLKSNFSINNFNNFAPTTINRDGFIEYGSTFDGRCAPKYNDDLFYAKNPVALKALEIHLSLADRPTTEWALIDGTNSFEQVFLNKEVSTYFAKAAGRESSDILMRAEDLDTINLYLISQGKICNLSTLYVNDQYRDETIKALANPFLSSMFKDLEILDLSNNNLWYVPMFGFKYLDGRTECSSFQNLKSLNLSNNKISHLPRYVPSKLTDVNNLDLTKTLPNIGNKIGDTENTGIISLDNNFLVFEPELYNIAKTDWSKQKQSSWVYLQADVLKKYISQQAELVGLTNLSKIDLMSQSPNDPAKKVIDEINAIVLKYYQTNFLGSSIVYNEASTTSSNASYCDIYIFANANLGSGEYVMSIVFKSFQYYNVETNSLEVPTNSVFFKSTVDGFLIDNTILILTSVFITVVGALVVSFVVYNLFLKKEIAAKRKKKGLDAMQNGMASE